MRARRVARVCGRDRARARGRSALDRAWIRSCPCTPSTVGQNTSYCNICVDHRDTNPNRAARTARHSATARDRRDASPRPRARAMPSAAYDNVVRGGLRLKTKASGVAKEAKKRHKKDKKREKKEVRRDATRRDRANARLTTTVLRDSFSQKTRADDDDAGADEKESSARRVDARTAAERAYDDAYRRSRERKMIEDMASKSHKDKVREFNEKLSKLSEHHDIPKVGPG